MAQKTEFKPVIKKRRKPNACVDCGKPFSRPLYKDPYYEGGVCKECLEKRQKRFDVFFPPGEK